VPFLSVLSGSPPAQRDAELHGQHGRPVEVEADQLELAREVVPVGVCPSSAARCVDPRCEELAREPGQVHASHVPSSAQLPIGDDLVEARLLNTMVWYGMVWCPSYPPSVCSVTEGGGVMQRGPIRSLGSVSNTDRQCNPRLFGQRSA
jgi:hypothetical protein